MSPCGIGVTFVILFIWAKFWQKHHLGSSVGLLSGVGFVLGGKSNLGFVLWEIHLSLTLCCSSSSSRPLPWCTFWAKVVGEMHLTSSGLHASITPASSMVSMLLYRYCCCGGINGFWWTFMGKVASGAIIYVGPYPHYLPLWPMKPYLVYEWFHFFSIFFIFFGTDTKQINNIWFVITFETISVFSKCLLSCSIYSGVVELVLSSTALPCFPACHSRLCRNCPLLPTGYPLPDMFVSEFGSRWLTTFVYVGAGLDYLCMCCCLFYPFVWRTHMWNTPLNQLGEFWWCTWRENTLWKMQIREMRWTTIHNFSNDYL